MTTTTDPLAGVDWFDIPVNIDHAEITLVIDGEVYTYPSMWRLLLAQIIAPCGTTCAKHEGIVIGPLLNLGDVVRWRGGPEEAAAFAAILDFVEQTEDEFAAEAELLGFLEDYTDLTGAARSRVFDRYRSLDDLLSAPSERLATELGTRTAKKVDAALTAWRDASGQLKVVAHD